MTASLWPRLADLPLVVEDCAHERLAATLAYDFERYTVVNTFDAHRIAHLGAARGLGDQIQERLLRAQLVEGEVLDDPATLVRLAEEVGIPAPETEAVLGSTAYRDEVEDDLRTAAALGIGGVPFFVIDRAIGVSGAQPADVFVQALTIAAERAVADDPTAAARPA